MSREAGESLSLSFAEVLESIRNPKWKKNRDFRIFVFTPLFRQGGQRLESVTVLENSSAQPV